jgi:TonB family protein
MNRFRFLLPVLAVFSTLLHASDAPGREEPFKKIEQAVSKTNIFELSSFQMKANVQIESHGKPLNGTYQMLWNGPNQWREEMRFPGYEETVVGGEDTVWIKRSTDFIPFQIFHVHAALGFGFGTPLYDPASLTQYRLTSNDTFKKTRTRKRHGQKLSCFEFESQDKRTSEICLNDSNGTITRESPYEDNDFQGAGEKTFPRSLSYSEDQKPVVKVDISQLVTPAQFAADSFVPPLGVSPQPGCMNPSPARITHKVNPQYPESARRDHIEGTVGVDVVIGTDGVPKINTVVASPHPDLEKSSLLAIKDWRYDPATCKGKPIQIETVLSVNYALRP